MRNTSGETIIETLVSVLITAVCFVGLQTSIVAAARINKQAEGQVRTFSMEDATALKGTADSGSVVIRRGTEEKTVDDVTVKATKDRSYYYYTVNK